MSNLVTGNEIILLSTSNDFFSKGDLIVFVKCMISWKNNLDLT